MRPSFSSNEIAELVASNDLKSLEALWRRCYDQQTMVTAELVIPARLAQFCKERRIKELALFGSALRVDFRPESDIDILVEFEPSAPIGFMEFAAVQEDLSELFGRDVDLVPKLGLKALIREEILSARRVLYAA